MSHGHHHHGHDHTHDHEHGHGRLGDNEAAEARDLSIPDGELPPDQLTRRRMFRRAGLLGAGLTAVGVLGTQGQAAATTRDEGRGREPRDGYQWLAGDHHIHTQYSSDGIYRVIDQVRHGNAYGLGWMVITDHGSTTHAKIGVDKVNPDIVAARAAVKDTLVFQGLEWNIPAAEHGTVFVAPGRGEVETLKEFENSFDGSVKGASSNTPQNEALAIAGLNFLAEAVRKRRVPDALFFANHPSRKGLDSPHEIRGWRDTAPSIAVGMEGAPATRPPASPSRTAPAAGAASTTATPAPTPSPATRPRATRPSAGSTG
ncbi:hypothetical protein ACFQYP_10990 [Nonomuraea antimicrobica]